MSQYEDCILYLLAKAHQRVYANFKRRLQPYGLTPVQLLVLSALDEEQGLSAGELGRRLMFDNATISGVLDRMAEGEWITKEFSRDDKRQRLIYLTSKAESLLGKLIQQMEDANEEVLLNFGLEEKLLLKRMLRDLQH